MVREQDLRMAILKVLDLLQGKCMLKVVNKGEEVPTF
jgi:hypothetical protein